MLFNRPICEIMDSIFILESIVFISLLIDFEGGDVSFLHLVHSFLFETRLEDCLPLLQFMLMQDLNAHEFIYNCR